MTIQRNDKVKISMPGRYHGAVGRVVKQAGYQYQAYVIAVQNGKQTAYDTIPTHYLTVIKDDE